MSAHSIDLASYALDLSMAAGAYGSHLANLAFFATCPEPEPLHETETFERKMRRTHRHHLHLQERVESPFLKACLERVGCRPEQFRIGLKSSNRDALQLITILTIGGARGRRVSSREHGTDRVIADRVDRAGLWFRDLALCWMRHLTR